MKKQDTRMTTKQLRQLLNALRAISRMEFTRDNGFSTAIYMKRIAQHALEKLFGKF